MIDSGTNGDNDLEVLHGLQPARLRLPDNCDFRIIKIARIQKKTDLLIRQQRFHVIDPPLAACLADLQNNGHDIPFYKPAKNYTYIIAFEPRETIPTETICLE